MFRLDIKLVNVLYLLDWWVVWICFLVICVKCDINGIVILGIFKVLKVLNVLVSFGMDILCIRCLINCGRCFLSVVMILVFDLSLGNVGWIDVRVVVVCFCCSNWLIVLIRLVLFVVLLGLRFWIWVFIRKGRLLSVFGVYLFNCVSILIWFCWV